MNEKKQKAMDYMQGSLLKLGLEEMKHMIVIPSEGPITVTIQTCLDTEVRKELARSWEKASLVGMGTYHGAEFNAKADGISTQYARLEITPNREGAPDVRFVFSTWYSL